MVSANELDEFLCMLFQIFQAQLFLPTCCSVCGRECEGNALQMSKLDFNDDSEKRLVEQVFGNAMESLADEDRQLPQVS